MLLVLLAVCHCSRLLNAKYYNILSVDGGGIKGLLPAEFINLAEKFSFEYAQNMSYNVPIHVDSDGAPRNRLHMSDLFDMLAGTSTGGIIAIALSMIS